MVTVFEKQLHCMEAAIEFDELTLRTTTVDFPPLLPFSFEGRSSISSEADPPGFLTLIMRTASSTSSSSSSSDAPLRAEYA
jgi:hypothetical protein